MWPQQKQREKTGCREYVCAEECVKGVEGPLTCLMVIFDML